MRVGNLIGSLDCLLVSGPICLYPYFMGLLSSNFVFGLIRIHLWILANRVQDAG